MSNATCVVTFSYQEIDYHCSICPPFYDGKDCSKGISSSASSISILFFSTRFPSFPYVSCCYSLVSLQAVVVRSTDNGIHRIDHVSIRLIAQYVFLTPIYWITILPLGSFIGPLNNWALLVAKVSLWFHKNEKKNPVLHVKERPLRGQKGRGGRVRSVCSDLFSVPYFFKLSRRLTAIYFQLKKFLTLLLFILFNPRFCQPQ